MRLLPVVVLLVAVSPHVQAQDDAAFKAALPTPSPALQIGRYTTQPALPAPEVAQPLRAVARISFPRGMVTTVGDALRHTLLRTGYRLVNPADLGPQARAFLDLPLPESQRVLGPYEVAAILQTLLGTAWRVQHDDVSRTVTFSLAHMSASTVQRPIDLAPDRAAQP